MSETQKKEEIGGVNRGSFEDNINNRVSYYMYRIDSFDSDAGRKVRRTWGHRRSVRYLLEQEQRTLYGGYSGKGNESAGDLIYRDFLRIEYRKLIIR